MLTLTKSYEFSASYSSKDRVTAHNYRLIATFEDVLESAETGLDEKVQDALIRKIHSRDLGRDVDLLKGASLSEASLLKIFWPILAKCGSPAALASLSLERDSRTRWTLTHNR